MQFLSGRQDMPTLGRAQERSFLLTNGLGGYSSMTVAFSAPRADQGVLVAAVNAPNLRMSMVHRISEKIYIGDREYCLSSQGFADGRPEEDGYHNLERFAWKGIPKWDYRIGGLRASREIAMGWETNTVALRYTLENREEEPCALTITPFYKFAPKEDAVDRLDRSFHYRGGKVTCEGESLFLTSTATLKKMPQQWQLLAYPADAKDGRPSMGLAASCCESYLIIKPGQKKTMDVVFSMEESNTTFDVLRDAQIARQAGLLEGLSYQDPVARQLVQAADAFITRKTSTGGKTIVAGYPLFGDWGRDTMIALPGCCLATGRYDDAKSILKTFLAYEKDGLVPNLFPEGEAEPMYNTVDAALLLIDCVWQYVGRTGDRTFLEEAYPVMERIIAAYQQGTHHGIAMDEDGLIRAGQGLDQVTWMDVCVNGILPTPRHGKPVEINAYWYNALRIMVEFGSQLGKSVRKYDLLAKKVKHSFVQKFFMPEKGYLKDVLSGTGADEQLRCNQIWAVSMSFTMLSPRQERSVVETVERHLLTACGLRTLSPEDREFHGFYGGPQIQRDMAYHQGTVWVFPLGAYYRAYLKVNGYSADAVSRVREDLQALTPMLAEGCLGQLPEIYDGSYPTESKGCFAQAWSVGEMLRVYEALEQKEGKAQA